MIYEEMKKFHHENSRKYHSTDSSELLLVETEYYSYRNFLPSAYSLAADWKVKFSLKPMINGANTKHLGQQK